MSAQKEKPRPHTPQAPPHAKGSSRGLPRHHHVETHFEGSETVRDVVLGMSDGLTVPFALAAGLSGAVASSRVVLVAGVAELAAGAIAMGLGGYLAAKSEADTWHSELRREHEEVVEVPAEEKEEVRKVFMGWGLEGNVLESATNAVCSDRDRWVDFMMREELHLSEPDPKRARVSALTIGGSYVAGRRDPARPVPFPHPHHDGPPRVGRRDPLRARRLRRVQGASHRPTGRRRGAPDGARRGARLRRRLRARTSHLGMRRSLTRS